MLIGMHAHIEVGVNWAAQQAVVADEDLPSP